MNPERFLTDEDTLVAYALGMLGGDEAKAVEKYLREHPDAALQVRAYMDGLTALVLSDDPADVSTDAEASLLAAIRTQDQTRDQAQDQVTTPAPAPTPAPTPVPSTPAPARPTPTRPRRYERPPRPLTRRPVWIALAAAAVIALAVWLGLPAYQDFTIRRQYAAYCDDASVTCQTLASADGEPVGEIARFADNTLYVVLTTPPDADRVYQAWQITDAGPASLGTFDARAFLIDEPLAPSSIFGVTQEPPGGSPQPTIEPLAVYELS